MTIHRHSDPYTVERTEIRDDTAAPWMLIVGIILAIGLAVGAYFAFVANDNDGGTTTNTDNTEVVVPPGDTGGDTSGDTTTDTGTTP